MQAIRTLSYRGKNVTVEKIQFILPRHHCKPCSQQQQMKDGPWLLSTCHLYQEIINTFLLSWNSSRYVEAFPLPNTQAITIARILVNEIYFRYSPQQLLSDLGSNFILEVVKETCKLLNIERIYTSPYLPQTDCWRNSTPPWENSLHVYDKKPSELGSLYQSYMLGL